MTEAIGAPNQYRGVPKETADRYSFAGIPDGGTDDAVNRLAQLALPMR